MGSTKRNYSEIGDPEDPQKNRSKRLASGANQPSNMDWWKLPDIEFV